MLQNVKDGFGDRGKGTLMEFKLSGRKNLNLNMGKPGAMKTHAFLYH